MWPDESNLPPSVGAESVRELLDSGLVTRAPVGADSFRELLVAENGMTCDECWPLIAGRARSHSRSGKTSRLKPLPQEAR